MKNCIVLARKLMKPKKKLLIGYLKQESLNSLARKLLKNILNIDSTKAYK